MTVKPIVSKRAEPTNCCDHKDGLGTNCRRRGWYRVRTGTFRVPSLCLQHAEIYLRRPLTAEERGLRGA